MLGTYSLCRKVSAVLAISEMLLGFALGLPAVVRLQSVQCSAANIPGGHDERLMSWFDRAGGSGCVAVAAQSGLRGLVVTRDVQVGDVLLDVPLTATLLDFSEQGSPLPGAALAWSASLPSKVQLALLVLSERNRGPWSAFLQSWPSQAPALPETLDDLTLVRQAHDPAVVAG